MEAAAESEQRYVDEALAQYEAYRAGRCSPLYAQVDLEYGDLRYYGAEGKQDWSIVYIHPGGDVVKPLGVGELRVAMKAVDRLGRGPEIWNRQRYPPPAVVLGGARHHFRPAHGTILLGVAPVGAAVVLLAALGEQLMWIHVEGRSRRVLFVGPLDVVEIDADRILRLGAASPSAGGGRARRRASRGPRSQAAANDAPAPPKVARASAATAAHHHRILHGVRLEPDDEARVAKVIRRGFADLVDRALAPERRPKGGKLRGKRTVGRVAWMLCELALRGVGDIVGTVGQIAGRLRRSFPEHPLTDYALGRALGLLHATGTCILRRDGRRWAIKIRALRNPTSAHHRRFCEETGDGCPDDARMLDEVGLVSAVAEGAGEGRDSANTRGGERDAQGGASGAESEAAESTLEPSGGGRPWGMSDLEAGLCVALVLWVLMLLGEGRAGEVKEGEAGADEAHVESDAGVEEGGDELNLGAGEVDGADGVDEELQVEPGGELCGIWEGAFDGGASGSEVAGDRCAGSDDAVVADVEVGSDALPGGEPARCGAAALRAPGEGDEVRVSKSWVDGDAARKEPSRCLGEHLATQAPEREEDRDDEHLRILGPRGPPRSRS